MELLKDKTLLLFSWSFLCAVLMVLAFPPIGVWPFSFLSVVLSLRNIYLLRENKKELLIFYCGYVFFIFGTSYYWLNFTFQEFGGMPVLVSLFIVLLVLSAATFVNSFLMRLWHYLAKKSSQKYLMVLFVGFALFLGYFEFRLFPWHPFMAFGVHQNFIVTASILGYPLWSCLFYLLASLVALASLSSLKKTLAAVGISVFVFLCLAFAGSQKVKQLKLEYPERQPVVLMQGNVGNFEKKLSLLGIDPSIRNVLSIYRDLIEESILDFEKYKAEQISLNKKVAQPWYFWPETSFPGFPQNDRSMDRQLRFWSEFSSGIHILGAYYEGEAVFAGKKTQLDYNVVMLYEPEKGFHKMYKKMTRMPFGEYVPFDEYMPSIYDRLSFLNHFGAGEELTLLDHPQKDGPVFISVICYEILKNKLINLFVREAEEKHPNREVILVNPSNDSWFGKSSEPFLHGLLSQWQAARVSLPYVRVTNTGISMVVAPWGEVLAAGPLHAEKNIFAFLPVKKAVSLTE